MSIDERLEALTQTVELLASMRKDDDLKLAAMARETDRRFAEVSRLFAETHEFINSLARIAAAHEERIGKLEDRQ